MEPVSRIDQLKEELRQEELKAKKAKGKIKESRTQQIALTPAKSESEGHTSDSSTSDVQAPSRVGIAAPLKKKKSTNASYKDIWQGQTQRSCPSWRR